MSDVFYDFRRRCGEPSFGSWSDLVGATVDFDPSFNITLNVANEVTTWTDRIAGIIASSALVLPPAFSAAGLNGEPGVNWQSGVATRLLLPANSLSTMIGPGTSFCACTIARVAAVNSAAQSQAADTLFQSDTNASLTTGFYKVGVAPGDAIRSYWCLFAAGTFKFAEIDIGTNAELPFSRVLTCTFAANFLTAYNGLTAGVATNCLGSPIPGVVASRMGAGIYSNNAARANSGGYKFKTDSSFPSAAVIAYGARYGAPV